MTKEDHLLVCLPVQITQKQALAIASNVGLGASTHDRQALALQRANWLLKVMTRRVDTKAFAETADPGWAIILDLFVREAQGKKTNVSAASMGSLSPQTTGLRWIALLENDGIIRRQAAPGDARQFLLQLTQETREELVQLLTIAV